jgi:ABC-type Fe2+-enterobactin transport system substrate-binding protein
MRKTVAVDASFLRAFLDPAIRTEAISNLVQKLSAENVKIIVQTPSLSQVLTRSPDSALEWMQILNGNSCFQVRPFDDKASFELAQVLGENATNLRDILRFDRQIVAIAKVYGVSVLYADDEQVMQFAEECGIPGKRLKDLD